MQKSTPAQIRQRILCFYRYTEKDEGFREPSPERLAEALRRVRSCLTERVHKSMFAQICQLILYLSNNKGRVDEFVRELTSAREALGTSR